MLNAPQNVQSQYADDRNLAVRMKLHRKYSTNPQGLTTWLFQQYIFFPGCRILECGCGISAQWEGRIEALPEECALTLTDLSQGMVDTTAQKYGHHPNVSTAVCDIQKLPYADGVFDAVIANFMLYHVADLPRAIAEVRRVLSKDGCFYYATNGDSGMRDFLRRAFLSKNPSSEALKNTTTFSLQSGADPLRRSFAQVKRVDYVDSLRITETDDLMDWLRSTVTISSYTIAEVDALYGYFEEIRLSEGAIHIPKETGMFICR